MYRGTKGGGRTVCIEEKVRDMTTLSRFVSLQTACGEMASHRKANLQ